MLFRGTQDGRVLAYDFKTGKRIWETTIADVKLASRCLRPRLLGRGWSSSATRAETTRVARGACTPSTRRPARSSGSSSWSPEPRARRAEDRRARRRSTWRPGKTPRASDQRREDLDIIHPRYEDRTAVHPWRKSGSRLRDRRARGRESLYQLGRRARRQDRRLQAPFQDCAEGLARLGRLQPARPDSNDGRQTS